MDWHSLLFDHWPIKFVSIVLVVAYVIDARGLRVPNWITFPLALSGIAFHTISHGLPGLGFALIGLFLGLATLLPLYAVGGMGAGDVKLMAGAGAWIGGALIIDSFIAIALVGGLMALVMVVISGGWRHHVRLAGVILREVVTLRDPRKMFDSALERKPTMLLLPYGIPVCIGAITTFLHHGLLV